MVTAGVPSGVRRGTRASLVLVIGALFLSPVTRSEATERSDSADECYYVSDVPTQLPENCDDPGDVVRITNSSGVVEVGAVVPAAGTGVTAHVDFMNGDGADLSLETSESGHSATANFMTGGGSTGSGLPDECADDAHSYLHTTTGKFMKVYDSYDWYFNANSTPSYMSVADAEASLNSAADRIAHTTNNCGAGDLNPKPVNYLGRGNFGIQVGTDADATTACSANPDGRSVVLFGALTSTHNVIAMTCSWFVGTTSTQSVNIVESDIRIDNNLGTGHTWWFYGDPCSDDYSLTAVVTHEMGHAFGLDHVSETTHGELTMSTHTAFCDTSGATLGYGDYKAIDDLYN